MLSLFDHHLAVLFFLFFLIGTRLSSPIYSSSSSGASATRSRKYDTSTSAGAPSPSERFDGESGAGSYAVSASETAEIAM